MADDDNNRFYVNGLRNHSVTHFTSNLVDIVVPDGVIASAKKNQRQHEWFMWKLHKRLVQALLDGRPDSLRPFHNRNIQTKERAYISGSPVRQK
jgi:hypothetical protein